MGAGEACAAARLRAARVSDNAPGRDAGCQRAVESQSSIELLPSALLLAQVLKLAQAWLTPRRPAPGCLFCPQA